MMRRRWSMVLPALIAAAWGCGLEFPPDAVGVNITEVNRIRADTSLSTQERREQLRELGLSDSTINGLLRNERTGNQFGGTLRSAYDKVKGGLFTQLTPDEIQFFGDAARTAGGPNFTLTDPQAQAISTFVRSQGLNTSDDVAAFLGDPNNVVPDTVPAGVMQQLFVDFDEDEVLDQIP
ncbi:MAG: hypothetical protein IPM64_01385 [Phycisphaerales bacterium]|nr:hypothetical protein [Phycisphaerales bacterium]